MDRDTNLVSLIRKYNIPTPSMMFRNIIPTSEFQKWLPRTPWSDYMLALLVARRGPWRYMDTAMTVYRKHGGGVWSGKSAVERVRPLVDFMEMLLRSKEYPHLNPLIAARRRDAVRELSIALACERKFPESCYQYLRSFGSRHALEGKFTSSSRYGVVLVRELCSQVGLAGPSTWFWRKVVRRNGTDSTA